MRRRILCFAAGMAGLVIVTTMTGGIYLRHQLRASLPQLEGTVAIPGLGAPVQVDRDALGVPTITAASRADRRARLVFCTRRIASSRWTSSAGKPQAS
jgi:acyl-homoserine lactone acylase PvdQ